MNSPLGAAATEQNVRAILDSILLTVAGLKVPQQQFAVSSCGAKFCRGDGNSSVDRTRQAELSILGARRSPRWSSLC